jgi:hypothetical protein
LAVVTLPATHNATRASGSSTARALSGNALQGLNSALQKALSLTNAPAVRSIGSDRAQLLTGVTLADMQSNGALSVAGSKPWTLTPVAVDGRPVIGAKHVEVGSSRATAFLGSLSVVSQATRSGIEQSFVLRSNSSGSPVHQINLSLGGGATLRSIGSTSALIGSGTTSYSYDKLAVYDARGRSVPARFAGSGRMLQIGFDSSGFAFPITVDPTLQTVAMTEIDNPSVTGDDYFSEGIGLNIDATTAAIGAAGYPGCDQAVSSACPLRGSGAIFVFHRSSPSSTTWIESAASPLTVPDGPPTSWMGHAVAMSGDGSLIVAGAPGTNANSGAAYAFASSNGFASAPVVTMLAPASPLASNALFGSAVAVSGSSTTGYDVIVGAPGPQPAPPASSYNGIAYVFTGSGTSFSPAALLTDAANPAPSGGDGVGSAVALSANGKEALVGAPSVGTDAAGLNDAGAAYVFTTTSNWQQATQVAELTAGGQVSNTGESVALSDDGTVAVLGAPAPDGTAAENDASPGAAYIFSSSTGTWGRVATLMPKDGVDGDQFGQKVAISGNGRVVLVGAPTKTVASQGDEGVVYFYGTSTGHWSNAPAAVAEYNNASTGQSGNNFGFTVRLNDSGSTALVGALGYAAGGYANVGAAYAIAYTGPGNLETASIAVVRPHKRLVVKHAVALKVHVKGDGTVPTGLVVIRSSAGLLCAAHLSHGVANCNVPMARVRHSRLFHIRYDGSSSYYPAEITWRI